MPRSAAVRKVATPSRQVQRATARREAKTANLLHTLTLLPHAERVEMARSVERSEAELNLLDEQVTHAERVQAYGSNPFLALCLRHFQHAMVDQDTGRFVPPAPCHHDLTARMHAALSGRNPRARIAEVMARDMAKTTYGTTFGVILAVAEYGKRNVLIVSASKEEAKDRIRNIVEEIETNETLRADYPDLRPAKDLKGQTKAYTDTQIILQNGAVIKAVEFGRARIRGRNWKHFRPDLTVLDDPEHDDLRYSPTLRERFWNWLNKALLRSLSKACVLFWFGTLLGDTSFLGEVRKPVGEDNGKGWQGGNTPIAYKVKDDSGALRYEPTWEARYTHEDIAAMVAESGPEAAEEELFNNPQASGSRPYDLVWFDDNQYDPRKLSGDARRGWEYNGQRLSKPEAIIDSASDTQSTSDWTSIWVVAQLPNKDVLVLTHRHVQWEIPDQLDLLADLHEQWGLARIYRQPSQLETVLNQFASRMGFLPFEVLAMNTSAGAKERRIRDVTIYYRNGKVKFAKDVSHTNPELMERAGDQRAIRQEMKFYPSGHDDCLDAGALILRRIFVGADVKKARHIGSAGVVARQGQRREGW